MEYFLLIHNLSHFFIIIFQVLWVEFLSLFLCCLYAKVKGTGNEILGNLLFPQKNSLFKHDLIKISKLHNLPLLWWSAKDGHSKKFYCFGEALILFPGTDSPLNRQNINVERWLSCHKLTQLQCSLYLLQGWFGSWTECWNLFCYCSSLFCHTNYEVLFIKCHTMFIELTRN